MTSPIKWYQDGFEHLNALRYHLFQLIDQIENDNRLAKALGRSPFSPQKLEDAKKALEDAETFFAQPKQKDVDGG